MGSGIPFARSVGKFVPFPPDRMRERASERAFGGSIIIMISVRRALRICARNVSIRRVDPMARIALHNPHFMRRIARVLLPFRKDSGGGGGRGRELIDLY